MTTGGTEFWWKRSSNHPRLRRSSRASGGNALSAQDCGGIWGYERLLKFLADPEHPEFEEMSEWAGEVEAELFDCDEVNEYLTSLTRRGDHS